MDSLHFYRISMRKNEFCHNEQLIASYFFNDRAIAIQLA